MEVALFHEKIINWKILWW